LALTAPVKKNERVVILGTKGLLGRDCVDVLEEAFPVIALARAQLDVTDRDQVLRVLGEIRPAAILNCTGFTHVDACEEDQESARAVNATGPRLLAEAALRLDAYLIHLSTDYVFDGSKPPPEPYHEGDSPAPLNVYGRTKWEGEEAVRSTTPNHLIIRTGWLYGRSGRSFPKAVLRQALRGKGLKVVNDQFGSPTWSRRLAQQILGLMEARVTGLVHATAQGHCTWYAFSRAILETMGIDVPVLPCTTEEYPRPAVRPANSILDNGRLRAMGLDRMAPWREDVERFIDAHGEALRVEALTI
jgi:dTDP-4-dehydrorhamnose reductase